MIKVDQSMDIRELKQQGHSIRDIARLTGLSRNTVRKVLRGQHPMKVQVSPRDSLLERPGLVQLVDLPHQRQVLRRLLRRLIVEARSVQPHQLALSPHAELRVAGLNR
jgi:transposase